MSETLALTLLRMFVGLVVAAHGAQKVFGLWGGPGLSKWHGMVATMGLRPPRLWANLSAFGELLGGLALAMGFMTPLVAAALVVNLMVAIWKVHLSKGFFVTAGGYEFALTLAIAYALIAITGAGPYSVDAAIGIGWPSATVFLMAVGIAVSLTLASYRPRRRLMAVQHDRRRMAA
jgi:putative oxidoreductase